VSLIPKFGGLLRKHEGHTRVTYVELFFDLVFVFALTQVTTLLADDLTWLGMLRGFAVLAVIWWAWVGYSWLTNSVRIDDDVMSRLVIMMAMVAMLVVGLAAAVPWLQASAQTPDPTAAEFDKFREIMEQDNPAELFEAKGEELWRARRGPKNASLEQCDLGLGPGVVKVKLGTTSPNTASDTMTLRYALAPRRL
jgi:hypothetical protein